MPDSSAVSTARNVKSSRMSDIVSRRSRSGGCSLSARRSRPRLASRSSVCTSPQDAERDGADPGAVSFLHGLAGERDAEARDIEPVGQTEATGESVGLELGGGEDRPRIRREDVAARLDVAAVDVEHGIRGPVERARAPEPTIGVAELARVFAFELGRDATIEDHRLARA